MSLSLPPVSIFPSPGLPTRPAHTHQSPTQTSRTSGADGPSQPASGSPLASAALYLYTFLATLVLLVGISLFIVVRSILQRRRRDRAVREAWLRYTNGSIPFREGDLDLIRFVEARMAQAGVALPRSGRIDLSKMPRMWDVHLAPNKFIDSEKTAEGKLISSSWKLNQRSNLHLDLKYSHWSWSSILPLSSSPLVSDQASTSNEANPVMLVDLNGRGNVPRTGVGRFFSRMLNTSGSAPAHGQGVADANTPVSGSSLSTTADNPNPNLVDGSTPSSSRSDHRTDPISQLEEGTIPMHGLGSSSSSSGSGSTPHPHHSNTTDTSISQTAPNTDTTENAEFSSTYPPGQQPAQGVGEVYESHKFPSSHPLAPNQNQEQNHTQSQYKSTPSGKGIDADKTTRMRVAVLVRMPTPPTASTSTSTPFPHSVLSKAESKAREKVDSGYEAKDEKRLASSGSSVSTLGGGDDVDKEGVQVSLLEVGLADVDVFLDCQGREVGER